MPPHDYTTPKADTNELSMTLKVDGVAYPFRLSDVTAAIELELYQQSGGLKLTQVITDVQDSPAGFHIAALVFLARRGAGDQVTFDEVASNMGLASNIEVDLDGAEDDSPEALGVD
jgi:hypothetical protein